MEYTESIENVDDENNDAAAATDDDDDDESEIKTTAEVLTEVTNAWLNEKFAPEILQHKSEYIDCLLLQISHMEDNIKKKLTNNDMRLFIYQQEIDRIRFIVSSYLRTRLLKIERYVINILKEESERNEDERLLTKAELQFARNYAINMETLLKSVVLQHLPSSLQEFEIEKLAVSPNLHAHVIMRANKKIDGVIIPGPTDEEVDFEEDSVHIISYKAIAHYIKTGDIQLI